MKEKETERNLCQEADHLKGNERPPEPPNGDHMDPDGQPPGTALGQSNGHFDDSAWQRPIKQAKQAENDKK